MLCPGFCSYPYWRFALYGLFEWNATFPSQRLYLSFYCAHCWPVFTSSSARQHLNIPKIKPVMLFIWLLTFFILINGFIIAPDIKEMIGTWDGQWVRPVLLFTSGILLMPVLQDRFPSLTAAAVHGGDPVFLGRYPDPFTGLALSVLA